MTYKARQRNLVPKHLCLDHYRMLSLITAKRNLVFCSLNFALACAMLDSEDVGTAYAGHVYASTEVKSFYN